MKLSHSLGLGDRSQIHNLVFLQKRLAEPAEQFHLGRGKGKAHGCKAGIECLTHDATSALLCP